MTTMMVMKDDRLVQKWRVKLIFQGTYRLSGTGIVECLKIIDVGCNLKQFEVEADRRCIFHFRL